MAKLGAVFLLAYLIFGTVAGDWLMHGPDTANYGRQLLLGSLILLGLFLVGIRATLRYRRFMGFSRWQWASMVPIALVAGITLRVYVL